MRNITLKLKNLKNDQMIDIISYANVHKGYPNDGFFSVLTKQKRSGDFDHDYDIDYYPLHLILKVESVFTKLYCHDSMTMEKRTVSIDEL